MIYSAIYGTCEIHILLSCTNYTRSVSLCNTSLSGITFISAKTYTQIWSRVHRLELWIIIFWESLTKISKTVFTTNLSDIINSVDDNIAIQFCGGVILFIAQSISSNKIIQKHLNYNIYYILTVRLLCIVHTHFVNVS